MSTKERKLEIIERVLHLNSDEELCVIEQTLEALATDAAGQAHTPPTPPRSAQELEADFQQALLDVKEGRVYSHEQVIALAQQWREKV